MTQFHFSPRPNRAHEIRWREWGEAAFAEARERDVPILLAISAVWCHWCHVMDETSYSTEDIIASINERYVPIRVDNDERPDVNRRYNMGGWPSTVFLTPDGEIIHGGTYLMPEEMYKVVLVVADVWRDKRDEIQERVAALRAREEAARAPRPGELQPDIVDIVRALVSGQYDPQYGGFGREQKFPQPNLLRFLLDEHRRHGAAELETMLRTTLDAMSAGGMYDHVEGGFFRYATERNWNTPHYEKMLEDNAELLSIYAAAHRVFPDRGYDAVARDVIRWMDTVLYQPETGLWSGSQDADEHYYTLDAAGRARHDPPFVDRRLYTSWNTLAASAYLLAGEALGDRAILTRGHDAVDAIERRLRDTSGAIYRFDAGDRPQLPDLLGETATFLSLLVGLGEVDRATALARRMRERLEDPERGGFYDTPGGEELGRLARRERPIEDNATAADALLRLAVLSGELEWRDVALRALRSFVAEYRQWGQFAASYANTVARALRDPVSVVVVGRMGDPAAARLWRAARAATDPDLIIQHVDPAAHPERLAARGFPDRVAAYVCVGTSCTAPLTDVPSLARELETAVRSATRV